MYYSEFTLKLIDEVRSREILYNTKYEKRPKSEKEVAWNEVGNILSGLFLINLNGISVSYKIFFWKILVDGEKCRKHWKNIRDRFVKIMHQRDRHFFLGGNELDAPQYIYYDKLLFMREFSIKKDPNLEAIATDVIVTPDLSPDNLVYEEIKEGTTHGTTIYTDCTDNFLELVKEFPILYDENAAMRKYRSRDSWRQIVDLLGGKFTVGKLRQYWTTLMKKYKLYLENPGSLHGTVENEVLFDKLSFANHGIQIKRIGSTTDSHQYIVQIEDELDNSSFLDESNEEHILCEEVDDDRHSIVDSEDDIQEEQLEEMSQAVESTEENQEPEPKKMKIEERTEPSIQFHEFKSIVRANPVSSKIIPEKPVTSAPLPAEFPTPIATISAPTTAEDEYDYFGKKIAQQLREIAYKNRSLARKGEIRVLQLLMELEESLEA